MEKAYAHAYLIEGPEGDARTQAVEAFVQKLLCPSASGSEGACGVCPTCLRVAKGTHEDVIRMTRSGKQGYKASDASVMMSRLAMHPYGLRNIGIIEEAERLSEVVQNKLLKTLEEPGEGTVIVLVTTNRSSLLDTVRSRCVLLRLGGNGLTDGSEEETRTLARRWGEDLFFYEARAVIGKSMKDRETALCFLDELETLRHSALCRVAEDGGETAGLLFDLEKIELARRDILRGMKHNYALKRMYLETGQKRQ